MMSFSASNLLIACTAMIPAIRLDYHRMCSVAHALLVLSSGALLSHA